MRSQHLHTDLHSQVRVGESSEFDDIGRGRMIEQSAKVLWNTAGITVWVPNIEIDRERCCERIGGVKTLKVLGVILPW